MWANEGRSLWWGVATTSGNGERTVECAGAALRGGSQSRAGDGTRGAKVSNELKITLTEFLVEKLPKQQQDKKNKWKRKKEKNRREGEKMKQNKS